MEGPQLLSCPALQMEAQAGVAGSLVQKLPQRVVASSGGVDACGCVCQGRWIS